MELPMTLQNICNIIILFGAVAGAIAAIWNLCGRPVLFFKKRKKQADDDRKKAEEERKQQLIKEISQAIKTDLAPDFDDIYTQNEEQTEKIAEQGTQIAHLAHTMRDTIGAEIIAFYEQHKAKRAITEAQKETIEDLYKEYKQLKGNHHVDNIYKRMWSWDIFTEDGILIKPECIQWWQPPQETK